MGMSPLPLPTGKEILIIAIGLLSIGIALGALGVMLFG